MFEKNRFELAVSHKVDSYYLNLIDYSNFIYLFKKVLDKYLWNAVRDFITFFSFVRLRMKFNTFFAFIKFSFLKTILTSYNVSMTRLSRIPHKTLSRPSFKSARVLKNVYLD